MANEAIDWGIEALKTSSEIASSLGEVGAPGLGLLGKFAQLYHSKYLLGKFDSFCNACEIDEQFINKILSSDTHANCFYGILETIRRTHSNIGVASIAIIYKEYWFNEGVLIPAMRAYSEIDDNTLLTFIELYDEIPSGKDFITLKRVNSESGSEEFHSKYVESVELIRRGFFIQSSSMAMAQNFPIQGTKFDHTDFYYRCTKEAIRIVMAQKPRDP